MKLLIVGASGLVGQGALQAALREPRIERVVALVRRPLAEPHHKLSVLQVDAFSPGALGALDLRQMDACLYCAGVLPIGMGEAAYAAITVDLTLNVARAYAAANPAGRFVYVSGAGADAGSRIMPLRVKGQAEQALQALPVRCIFVRPGIVRPADGARSPHTLRQAAYRLAQPALGIASRLVPGFFTTTTALGQALVRAACEDMPEFNTPPTP
jgi:uncharacterized protein YbjT (DUF2867 family)